MKTYTSDKVRNIALIGHASSGKTTLAETMAFESNTISRRGSVEDHNTVSDYHEIEHERGNSIYSTLLHSEWREGKINIIDTPGFDDFIGEVITSLRVADTAVLIINGSQGVEVGSEITYDYAKKFEKPVIFVVNQMDHEKADFDTCVDGIKSRLTSKAIAVQYPTNAGTGFNSIIDVLKMVMYVFPEGGGKPEKHEIPENAMAKAKELHNALVEAAAENDEALMELYFEKGSLDEDEMKRGLNAGMINRDLYPIFCISAINNMGSGRLMGFINNVSPVASDMLPLRTKDRGEHKISANGDPAIYIYKTATESHLGEMSFFKVVSGILKSGADLINENTGANERLNQINVIDGKNRTNINELHAGDIGATVKLKNSTSGDTLHLKGSQIAIAPTIFPDPKITTAVVTVNSGDEEKAGVALNTLSAEDPTLIFEHSRELKQMLLHGQGEMHLQMVKLNLENNHKVKVDFVKPKIAYRETIQKAVKSDYKHKKQSGGSGQFGEVHMLVEPYFEGMAPPKDLNVKKEEVVELEWGGKLVVCWCIVGGAIDAKYINAITKGIMEKMEEGPLTGSYVRDVRVSIYDGKMHPVDSNDMAFKLAARAAFKNAFVGASPKILEPTYKVQVWVPDNVMGDVMGDLQGRRAIIEGMETEGTYQKIVAKVPLSEMNNYVSALRSITQGRAKFNMEFADYQGIPGDLQKQLINEYNGELETA